MLFKQGNPGSYAAIDEFNRFFLNRVCLIPEDGKVPGHTCLGLNRIKDYDGFFMTHDIISYAKKNALNPQTIPFADIWYQIHYEGEKEHVMQTTHRYRDADVAFPGIVAAIKNPDKKPFRMLDGRRRLWKQQEAGAREGLFFVIPVPEVYRFFWMVMPMDFFRKRLEQIKM